MFPSKAVNGGVETIDHELYSYAMATNGDLGMTAETQAYRPAGPSFLQALVKFREAGIILIIVVLAVLVGLRNPVFLTPDNFRDIVLNISILVIVALAQTMII